MDKLLIGELAKRTGLSAPTIRYYEEIGLIPKPRRSASGYRQYSAEIVNQLRFVQLAQVLGLSLDQVRPLLRLINSRARPSASVLRSSQQHLATADRRIRELEEFRARLRALCVSST